MSCKILQCPREKTRNDKWSHLQHPLILIGIQSGLGKGKGVEGDGNSDTVDSLVTCIISTSFIENRYLNLVSFGKKKGLLESRVK